MTDKEVSLNFLKSKIALSRVGLQMAEKELNGLFIECKKLGHNIVKKHFGAYCTCCEERFGWYCPDSPDHVCHYYSEDGKIELIDGTKIDVPPGYANREYETDDQCIYCGQPEERK